MNAADEWSRVSDSYFRDGKYWTSQGSKRRTVIDPSCNEVIGHITEPTAAEIDDVVASAHRAQRHWYSLSALERTERLHDVAASIRGKLRAEIAELLTRETGKPFKESADEMLWAASAVDYYAELGRHSIGAIHGSTVPGQMHYTVKEPMGTVVLILPANFPICLMMWSAGAALAAGNAVIVKPSEYATMTTLSFMRAFEALPDGVVQCVPGGADVGKQLVAHHDTHMIGFTGSVTAGQAVARTCAETFKPFLIEASGSDAFLVMPSAPIEIAARAATFASFLNCGQVCTSAEKILVHNDVYDEFIEALTKHVAALRVGHGLDNVDIGPMEHRGERDRVERILERAVAQGAKIVAGGKRPELDGKLQEGFFFEPTVLVDLTPEMEIFSQEIFGPIAAVYRVASFDEALQIVDRSPFGLGATLYSRDAVEIDRATREIESGMVWINAPVLDNDAGPFGGRKMSGIGRQLGAEGLDAFRHPKLVIVDPAASPQDFWWFPYQDDEAWRAGTA